MVFFNNLINSVYLIYINKIKKKGIVNYMLYIVFICMGIILITICALIKSKYDVIKIERERDKLLEEIEYLERKINSLSAKEKEKESDNVSCNKIINNTNYFIGNTYVNSNIINVNNTVINDKSDFISWIKSECNIIDGEYVIPKTRVASMMYEYNKTEKEIFHNCFIIIYDKIYITQSGINYLSKQSGVIKIHNDLVNQNLIICFHPVIEKKLLDIERK